MNVLNKMYDQLHWANLRILEALRAEGDGESQAKKLFSHILQAERIWYQRIRGLENSTKDLWTELSLDKCSVVIEENNGRFLELLKGVEDCDLDSVVRYRNSTGKEFETSMGDILTHVALHGQYHRGQINRVLREKGLEPVNVDYITFVR